MTLACAHAWFKSLRRPKLDVAMASSVAVAAIVSHFEHIQTYAVALDNAGRDGSAMVASQAGSILNKIRNVDVMGCEDATLFIELASSMPFSAEDADRIQRAVDERVLAGSSRSVGANQQHCDTFQHWLLEADWKRLDNCSVPLGCDVVAAAGHRVGIRNPSERLLGRMAAMVAIFGLRNGNPAEALLRNLKSDIQKSIKTSETQRPSDLPQIKHYPSRPHMMPPDFLRRVFPDETPVDAQDYATLTIDHICTSKKFLRSTATALRGCAAQHTMQQPSWQGTIPCASMFAHQAQDASSKQRVHMPSLEDIRPWKPRAAPAATMLALPAPECDEVNPLDVLKAGLKVQEAELQKAKAAGAQAKKDKASAAKKDATAGKGEHKAEAKAKTTQKNGLIKAMARDAISAVAGNQRCTDVMQGDLEEDEDENLEKVDDEETEGDGTPAAEMPAISKKPATSNAPAAAMKRPAARTADIAEAKAHIIAFARNKRAAKESTSQGAFTTKAYKNMLSLTKDKDEAKASYKIAAVTWNAACA